MPNTYTKIASVAVGAGGAAYMEFTSIPATYTDLKICFSAREATAGDYIRFSLDINATGTGLGTSRILWGNGSTANSGTEVAPTVGYGVNRYSSTANVFSNTEIYIPNYTVSQYKSIAITGAEENNATAAFSSASAVLWSNNATITSIKIYSPVNVAQYSTATLYGISKS